MAKLRVRATSIEIKRQTGDHCEGLPRTVPVNIVWVHEVDPPPDEPAVEEVFPDDDVLASLVAMEKNHVAKVMELMVTGARFRGLGDRFST